MFVKLNSCIFPGKRHSVHIGNIRAVFQQIISVLQILCGTLFLCIEQLYVDGRNSWDHGQQVFGSANLYYMKLCITRLRLAHRSNDLLRWKYFKES